MECINETLNSVNKMTVTSPSMIDRFGVIIHFLLVPACIISFRILRFVFGKIMRMSWDLLQLGEEDMTHYLDDLKHIDRTEFTINWVETSNFLGSNQSWLNNETPDTRVYEDCIFCMATYDETDFSDAID